MPKFSMKSIKPKTTVGNYKATLKAIEAAKIAETEDVVKDFEKTWKTWRHKPRVTVRITKDGAETRVNDQVWNWLDQGTKPHVIMPRRAKRLRFQLGFTPKTRVGSLSSGGGGSSGPTVFSRGVNHPGTKARGWSELIQEASEKRFPGRVQIEITKATGGEV